MADRKGELERKKQRLEQMRADRKRQEEEKLSKRREESGAGAGVPMMKDLRSETEDLLKDLGIPLTADSPGSQASEKVQAAGGEAVGSASEDQQLGSKRAAALLTVSKVTQTNIPPREIVTYTKETQTPKEVVEKEGIAGGGRGRHREGSGGSSQGMAHHGSPKFLYPHLEWDDDEFALNGADEDGDSMDVAVDTPPPGSHKLPHTAMHEPAESDEKREEKPAPPPPRELSEEEKKTIMMSDEFSSFFMRSARYIERALCETVDIFTDYAGAEEDDQDKALLEGEQLKLNRTFFDDRWSKYRTVTSLDWSTQFPELILSSYNKNPEAPNEPDGAVLVWNTKYKKDTPEFVLHCQSAVTSACFAKFHPNLIIGGTYSGQIVVWDNRSNKHTPAQRTPLSSAVHTHPVYCTNMIGTQNAHNLASLSTDGKMCYWSLDMMTQPQDSVELQYKQNKTVSAICCAFPANDFNNFFVGTEDCSVYSGCRHGSKAGVNELFEGHQGPVTSIDCHSVPGQIDFSSYFISSSFDWTVKLWNSKEMKPLHSFEDYSEYVYDCKWSPIHPALFATVDGAGRLDLWNLNMETEVPSATKYVEGNAALNKCRWHQGGHVIATGDDSGRVQVYDVGEAIAAPRADEWLKFSQVLNDLKAERADREEDEQHISSLSQSPMR